MSAGQFIRTRYQSNEIDRIYPCRVQPETVDLTIDGVSNAPISALATEPASARMKGSRRDLGVNARSVRIAFTGTPPAGYSAGKVLSVPVLTPSLFDSIARGQVGTYLGAAIEVVGKTPEYIN